MKILKYTASFSSYGMFRSGSQKSMSLEELDENTSGVELDEEEVRRDSNVAELLTHVSTTPKMYI